MAKYTITIHTKEQILQKVVEYATNYELQKDVVNIGINGYLQVVNEKTDEEYFTYYPSHKIEKIEVLKNK